MSLRAIKKRSLGRLQLLSWLNSFLESDYAKIDHLGDGVAYMQILDAVFPKKVPLHKLNFDAQSEDERLSNLRILERSFEHVGLKKDIQAKRLAKCKFAANCELLQWCYDFVHRTYPDSNYQYRALERRQEALARKLRRRDQHQKSRRSRGGTATKRTPSPDRVVSETNVSADLMPSNEASSLRPGLRKSPPKALVIGDGSPTLDDVKKQLMHRGGGGAYMIGAPQHRSPRDDGGAGDTNVSPEAIRSLLAERIPGAADIMSRLDGAIDAASPPRAARPDAMRDERGASPAGAVGAAQPMMPDYEVNDARAVEVISAVESKLTNDILSQRILEDEVESVRVERDFYFDTLRAIEDALRTHLSREPSLANSIVAHDLLDILQEQDTGETRA